MQQYIQNKIIFLYLNIFYLEIEIPKHLYLFQTTFV